MENNRHTSEIKWLRPSQVKVDIDLYQRAATNLRVKKILDDWNYDLVNMPKVSMRMDGSMYAFDGHSHLFKNFPQFVVIYTIKCFSVVNEADVDVFLEFPCFFCDPMEVGSLITLTKLSQFHII